jgi:hypothetical protein
VQPAGDGKPDNGTDHDRMHRDAGGAVEKRRGDRRRDADREAGSAIVFSSVASNWTRAL